MERIELSQRERDRLKGVHEVEQGHLTQVEAGRRLQLSDRQVRRLLVRVGAEGDRGVIHRLRGRPSNRKIPARVTRPALRLLGQPCYAGFGPTLAAEHLARAGMAVSRETLRGWMTGAGLWPPRRQKVAAVHVWRERRTAFGELVLLDTSEHAWLEERSAKLCLIALIDDATSRLRARFVEHDTTEENLRTLEGWLRRYGHPLALYTDKDSIFQPAGPPSRDEQLRGTTAHPVWLGAGRVGYQVDPGTQFAGQRAHQAVVRHPPGPVGEADAAGRGVHPGECQSLPGDHLLAGMREALHGPAAAAP